jgi:hypothetical protein
MAAHGILEILPWIGHIGMRDKIYENKRCQWNCRSWIGTFTNMWKGRLSCLLGSQPYPLEV